MTVAVKVLVPAQTLPLSSAAPLYTCAATAAIVDKVTAYNNSASVAATLNLTVGVQLLKKTLQPEESYTCPEITGQVLVTGQTIVATTSAATINFRASGREVT
jgi:hypothetical protein